MNAKSILRWALLLIVVGSIGAYALQRSREADPATAVSSPSESIASATVVVTYFTTDVRCDSCRTIEALSRRAIEEGFPNELDSGAVIFRVVNTDLAENRHFIDEYKITNKTVIVSHQLDGNESEYVNRQKVWELLDDPSAFLRYVQQPVRSFLGES